MDLFFIKRQSADGQPFVKTMVDQARSFDSVKLIREKFLNLTAPGAALKLILAWRPFYGAKANSADPDQMPHNAASDQGLHFLLTGCSFKI